jgi:hypothetical protein
MWRVAPRRGGASLPATSLFSSFSLPSFPRPFPSFGGGGRKKKKRETEREREGRGRREERGGGRRGRRKKKKRAALQLARASSLGRAVS